MSLLEERGGGGGGGGWRGILEVFVGHIINFENVENNNSRKLHDIIDMFNLTHSVSEPTHKQGHLLDLVFSKQGDNSLISTKLHHGLTSDHTAILCKLDVSVPVQSSKYFVPMPQKDWHRRL